VATSNQSLAHTKCRLRLECDGTRAEIRFRLSAKRRSPFKWAGASVQSTTGSRSVRISGSNGSNAGYNTFRGSVKGTGYPLLSPVSPSIPLPCVTVCHHVSSGLLTHILPKLLFYARFVCRLLPQYCSDQKLSASLGKGAPPPAAFP